MILQCFVWNIRDLPINNRIEGDYHDLVRGQKMRNWYTADTHFGDDSNDILIRDMRPFKDITEYTKEQVRIWNEQASADDTIYVLGDFCNYNIHEKDFRSGLAVSKLVNAHIICVIGNSEERVIDEHFDGDFNRFREYCLTDPGFKFDDVIKNKHIDINGTRFFLTHKPSDHDKSCLTLFGHVHRGLGLYRPFGFNMSTDINNFRLFSDDDIVFLMKQKRDWWDNDPDVNCNDIIAPWN